ncbi:MAG: CinA family protein [Chromatiales bacterium]|jgi:nicotinamide-nucleotide amidase|nr:CinA family protein [Chromatiales bacterium]
MASAVAKQLSDAGQTVAVAESSTGGLLAAALLAMPGASRYFMGGIVMYTSASRRQLLGMRRNDVEGLRPMSEAMAMAFARRTREVFDCTWGIAELGAAGPTGTPYGEGPGVSVIAVDGPRPASIRIATGQSEREPNMWRFTQEGIALLEKVITPEVTSETGDNRTS